MHDLVAISMISPCSSLQKLHGIIDQYVVFRDSATAGRMHQFLSLYNGLLLGMVAEDSGNLDPPNWGSIFLSF